MASNTIERIPTAAMTREQWLQERKLALGGSDMGAILGLNQYRSAVSVWADKLSLVEETEDNEAMRVGRDLEPYVASRFEEATPKGQTVERKQYLVCGNHGTSSAPQWGKLGKRVEDSSAEMDWSEETKKDILGDTYTTMKTPIISQTFDPCELDSGDEYQQKVWNLAVVDQDAPALCNQDLLRIHLYAVDEQGRAFAERYPSSMVKPTGLGGEGGGTLTMPIDVTFGGTRQIGTATCDSDGVITFTPATAAAG